MVRSVAQWGGNQAQAQVQAQAVEGMGGKTEAGEEEEEDESRAGVVEQKQQQQQQQQQQQLEQQQLEQQQQEEGNVQEQTQGTAPRVSIRVQAFPKHFERWIATHLPPSLPLDPKRFTHTLSAVSTAPHFFPFHPRQPSISASLTPFHLLPPVPPCCCSSRGGEGCAGEGEGGGGEGGNEGGERGEGINGPAETPHSSTITAHPTIPQNPPPSTPPPPSPPPSTLSPLSPPPSSSTLSPPPSSSSLSSPPSTTQTFPSDPPQNSEHRSSSEAPQTSPPPRRTRRDCTPVPLVPPDARIFFSLSPARSMWRLASDRKAGSDGCASSAVSKLEEVLHVVGWRLREDMTAMDVGAAPGAWTEYLSARMRHVLAIDPAALSPAVTARGNVTHIKKMVEDAWDDVQAWSLACQADSQPQPTGADGHDTNRVHEPGTDTAAPTTSSTSGITSSRSSSGIASSVGTTPMTAGSSERGGGAGMCHGLFCDANKHPLQAATLVAPLLPALASGGILVVTMKCRGRGRDKELLTQQLTEALPVSFRYAECVWLMANSVFERTFVGIKA
ncbi:unnamed protein product [Closterium sp. Naga37s-1]|nr:unnamed protein product [Closterium sp. Naga37s-1]